MVERTLILNNEEECKQIRDSGSPEPLKGWKRDGKDKK